MRPSHPDYEGLQVRPVENYPQVVHYSDKEALPDRVAKSPGARACTVSRPVFIALLFVAVLIVVGAAVGGGVGAVLAAKKSKSTAVGQMNTTSIPTTLSVSTIIASPTPLSLSSSTSSQGPTSITSTTSSTTPSSPTATLGMGTYNCPSDNGTSYTPNLTNRYTFEILCDTDFYGKGINKGNVVDIQNILATSIEACIDQCAAQRYAGGNCSAVSYGSNITLALSRGGVQGNCFLKDQRSVVGQPDTSGQQEGAFLLSS